MASASRVPPSTWLSSLFDRFPTVDSFRQWTGWSPPPTRAATRSQRSRHPGRPNIVKATLFLDAHVARRYDPQLVAIYYKQMVLYGKHYTQAICVSPGMVLIVPSSG